jgi:hypothetical protein
MGDLAKLTWRAGDLGSGEVAFTGFTPASLVNEDFGARP